MKSFAKFLSIVLIVLLSSSAVTGQDINEDFFSIFKYRNIGPTRQSGRFVDIAVPLIDTYTIYMATASGGLWKSDNNGRTWNPIFDNENVISIGAVAVSQSNPDVVWVGSGESNNSRSAYWGDGVYKSTDAGKTWTNVGLPESHHIGRIATHPTNENIAYVAATGKLYTDDEHRGLYKTTDSGQSWKKVLNVESRKKNIGIVDVVMDPSNPEVLYATAYDKVRKPWTFNLAGPGSGIYKTTDGGANWTKLEGGLPTGMLGRIGIDVYEKDSNILFAVIENANKKDMSDKDREKELLEGKSSSGMYDGQVYRSDDAGMNWKLVSPVDKSTGGFPGYYYGQIIIDPNDADHVYVLSVGVLETKDGGDKWNQRAFRFGGDNHALWINPADSRHMILGYDHGMGITYDSGKNWYHPDEQPLAQFYAIGIDFDYPYNVYGGIQDNGSVKGPSTTRSGGPISFEMWKRVGGGDGFYNQVDPTDSRWLYNESQFGSLSRFDQKTGVRTSIKPQDEDLRFNWNSPILISPHDSKTIYFGANKLMRSRTRGDVWEEASGDLTSPDPKKLSTGKGGDGNIQYSTITTIDESPIVEGLIWVGTDDGNVQLTRDGGKTWTKMNDKIKGNPEYWVSRVTASFHYPGTAYVTYTGFRRDDFRPFVYKTTDFGDSWTMITNGLPQEAVNVIKEDTKNPNLLFLGNEKGTFVSLDAGASWTSMKNNMPTNGVQDLVIHPRENDLIVSTHGRGMYITDIAPLQQLNDNVTSHDAYLFDITPRVKWVTPPENVTSAQNFAGEPEESGVEIYYYLKEEPEDDVTITVKKGNRVVNELVGSYDKGINLVHWNIDAKKERSQEDIDRYVSRMERFGREVDPESDQVKYESVPLSYGEYTVTLTVGSFSQTTKAVVLQDHWYDK